MRRLWRDQVPKNVDVASLSEKLRNLLTAQPYFSQTSVIGLFASRPHEPDITPLWSMGQNRCVFPRVNGNSLEFFSVNNLGALSKGYAAILEPPDDPSRKESFSQSEILILVPGICFDRKGHRLGSGKGFYDRFVSSLAKNVHLWGVCFEEQLSQDLLPQEPTDLSVEAICTPSRFIAV